MTAPPLGNLVPYLFYADIEAMIDWYARGLRFRRAEAVARRRRERAQRRDARRRHRALDGRRGAGRHQLTDPDGKPFSLWIGVWLTDRAAVDAMYEHVVSQGAAPEAPPEDLPYGVRAFNVSDPEGYSWGFMCHIPSPRARSRRDHSLQADPYFCSWCVRSSIATTPSGSGACRLIVRPSGSRTKASTTAQCCGSNGCE